MKDYRFVVLTRPVAGKEDEYNHWYDTRHVPDVISVPGVNAAQRFVAEVNGEKQYLAIYDVQTDDPQALFGELSGRAGTDRMPMSDALDLTSTSAIMYEAIGPKQTAQR